MPPSRQEPQAQLFRGSLILWFSTHSLFFAVEPVLLGSPMPPAAWSLLLPIQVLGLSGEFPVSLDDIASLVLFSRHFVAEILAFCIYYCMGSFSFQNEFFLSWAFRIRNMLFKTSTGKEINLRKCIHKPRERQV